MKMYQDYDLCRDQSSKYFDAQDTALIPCFISSEYYPKENSEYMREFDGGYNSNINNNNNNNNNTNNNNNNNNGIDSTATFKPLMFATDLDEDVENWKRKEPKCWNNSDVLHWIANVAEYHKFPYESVNASAFNVSGEILLSYTKRDFLSYDQKYGSILYMALHKSPMEEIQGVFQQSAKLETLSTPDMGLVPLTSETYVASAMRNEGFQNDTNDSSESYPFELDPVNATGGAPPSEINSNPEINNNNNNSGNINNSNNSTASDNSICSDTDHSDFEVKKKNKKGNGKRPPGRPPGVKTNKERTEKKTGRLWEFIRDLLLDPQHCPSVICWENHDDGVFRFVKSEKVAKIWGDRKGNQKMNYEKLSRAMRYYYRSKVLQPVIGRRLVYKFGPTARGWKTENPNFRH